MMDNTKRLATVLGFVAACGCFCSRDAIGQRRETLHIYDTTAGHTFTVDPNGFLLNPRWLGWPDGDAKGPPRIEDVCRFRATTGHLGRRTLKTTRNGCLSDAERSLVTVDESEATLAIGSECVTGARLGNLHGHVNWFPVTTTGQLRWNSFAKGVADHDVNMDLFPPLPNAVVFANSPSEDFGGHRPYHMEFYYDETLGDRRLRLDPRSFWGELDRLHTDSKEAGALVSHRFAIATGVYGLDGVHDFHAELHPLFAIAVLVDTVTVSGRLREQWALMFRNSGSEGDCGQGALPLLARSVSPDSQQFVLDLGWWQNAPTPDVALGPSASTAANYAPTASVHQDAAGRSHLHLVFRHPTPVSTAPEFEFFGTIFVDWALTRDRRWASESRLGAMMPGYTHPRLVLDSLQMSRTGPQNVLLASTEDDDPARAGPDVMQAGASVPGSEVRVYKNAPWALADSGVGAINCSESSPSICHSPTFYFVGLSYQSGHAPLPMGSHFRFPHSRYYDSDAWWANAFNIFYTLGVRLDLREDAFRPVEYRSDGTAVIELPRQGPSFRWSPFVAPNAVELGHVSIAPMTIGNFGVSWIPSDKHWGGFNWTSGWGLGLFVNDFFADVQSAVRGGRYDSHWVLTAGWLKPFWRN